MIQNAALPPPQIGGHPTHERRKEIGVEDGIKEKCVVDDIERFANVYGDGRGTLRRLPLIESIGNSRRSRKKGSGGGTAFSETVLSRSGGEGGGEEGEEETFENLGGGAKEGNWAEGGREMGRFAGLGEGDYGGTFPDGGEV